MGKLIRSLQLNLDWGRSDCKDHFIHISLCDHLYINHCIFMNSHHSLCLRTHLQCSCFHLTFSRSFSCKEKFSAQCICRFEYCHLMPSFMKDPSCFHTGYTSADHPYFFSIFCRIKCIFCLMSDHRISHTSNVRAVYHITKSIIASLITSDTVYNILYMPFFCLVCKLRICKLCSSHHHHIHFIICNQLFCQCSRIDSSNTDCHHTGFLSNPCCVLYVKCIWHIDRRNFIHGCCCNNISPGNI